MLAWDDAINTYTHYLSPKMSKSQNWLQNHFVKLKKHPFHSMTHSHVKSDLWKLKRFNISRFPSGLLGFQAKRPEQCLHSHVSFRSHTHARKRGRQCLATVWAEAMLRPWAGQSWVTKSMFSMTVFNSQQYRADD